MRDCASPKGNLEGTRSQATSAAPLPKGTASANKCDHNYLYALSTFQHSEPSPNVVMGMLLIFSSDFYVLFDS